MIIMKQKRECPICKNCGNRKFKVLDKKEEKNIEKSFGLNNKRIQCLKCGNIMVLI
jgi:hypothetical protein